MAEPAPDEPDFGDLCYFLLDNNVGNNRAGVAGHTFDESSAGEAYCRHIASYLQVPYTDDRFGIWTSFARPANDILDGRMACKTGAENRLHRILERMLRWFDHTYPSVGDRVVVWTQTPEGGRVPDEIEGVLEYENERHQGGIYRLASSRQFPRDQRGSFRLAKGMLCLFDRLDESDFQELLTWTDRNVLPIVVFFRSGVGIDRTDAPRRGVLLFEFRENEDLELVSLYLGALCRCPNIVAAESAEALVRQAFLKAIRAATEAKHVLIVGETGTGRKTWARFINSLSLRPIRRIADSARDSASTDRSASDFGVSGGMQVTEVPLANGTCLPRVLFSNASQRLFMRVSEAAGSQKALVLEGEEGTDKEVWGHLFHERGPKKDGQFVWATCDHLAELDPKTRQVELFGSDAKPNGCLLQRARQGLLYLDRVQVLPRENLKQLFLAIEQGMYRPLGSSEMFAAECQLVLAIDGSLKELLQQRELRTEPLRRPSIDRIEVPPIRDRPDDILPIFYYFARRIAPNVVLTRGAAEVLQTYDWPGNFPEISKAADRTCSGTDKTQVALGDLPGDLVHRNVSTGLRQLPC
jgi:hypothetical protein